MGRSEDEWGQPESDVASGGHPGPGHLSAVALCWFNKNKDGSHHHIKFQSKVNL